MVIASVPSQSVYPAADMTEAMVPLRSGEAGFGTGPGFRTRQGP